VATRPTRARQRQASVELRQHRVGAGEAAGARAARAAHLLHRPVQGGLDRRGGGVDVVAVQAQAGFQAQRVARAQAHGLDLGLCQQGTRQRFGLVVHRDLEAVFAGVAAARDEQVRAGPTETATGHEDQFLDTGHQARQGGDRLRALQGQQRALRHRDDVAALADPGLDVGDVAHLAGAIDDDKEVVRPG
jgi:hypothetical protein